MESTRNILGSVKDKNETDHLENKIGLKTEPDPYYSMK